MLKRKKRAMQIGQGKVETKSSEPVDDPSNSTSFHRKIVSDYYATKEEDPLIGSKSFKKKKKGQVGQKRLRDEEDGGDIIAMLESQAAD